MNPLPQGAEGVGLWERAWAGACLHAKLTSALSVETFIVAETALIASVLAGYVVLGTIAGSPYNETFNVYRTAPRVLSLIQSTLYLPGLSAFVTMIVQLSR